MSGAILTRDSGDSGARAVAFSPAAAPIPPALTGSRSECVVVDDDPDIRDAIVNALSRIGVTSAGVASPGALSRALTTDNPGIVFLDIGLDRWDAVDGLKLLAQHRFNGAVQLISGKQPAILHDVHALGKRQGLHMLAPVRKPFVLEHLLDAVRRGGLRTDGPSAPRRHAGPEEAPAVDVSLATAIERRWLDTLYQPKVDITGTRIVGAEGLARVRHPTLGLVGPAGFLPDATDADLARLTEFVVLKAFRDWEVLDRAGCNIRLAVNAPVAALASSRLTSLIRERRPESEDWPGLIIEVTESDAIMDIDLTMDIAVQLRIYGIELAIDDFGTGYSSFSRLKQFAFREIKLDRSYVQNCASDPVNACICQAVINLAHTSRAMAVAEGIEQTADREALTAMGCDLAQGFLFARPMSVGKLIEMNARQQTAMRPRLLA